MRKHCTKDPERCSSESRMECSAGNLEDCLIKYCSPTLASLKTANLFNMRFPDRDGLLRAIDEARALIEEKGIRIEILSVRGNTALIYVYRLSHLERDLKACGAARVLKCCGYSDTSVPAAIEHLKERIRSQRDFPHEIGLFLGYPPADVCGFIENHGRNYICCGAWKVYCDECAAITKFEKYDKCKRLYARLFGEGIRTIRQLTVAA